MQIIIEYFYCLIYVCSLTFCIYRHLDRKPSYILLGGFLLLYGFIDFVITGDYIIHMNQYIIMNSLVLISDFIMISMLNKKLNFGLLFYTSLYSILFIGYVNILMYLLEKFSILSILDSFSPSLERLVIIIVFNLISVLTYKALEKFKIIPQENIVFLEHKLFNLVNIICYFVLLIFFGSQINKIDNVYSLIVLTTFIGLWLLLIHTNANTIEVSLENQKNIMVSTIYNHIEDYLEQQRIEEDRIKKIRHDMKNHLLVLKNISNEGKVIKYIEDINDDFKKVENVANIYSGNVYLDAIINIKKQQYSHVKIFHSFQLNSFEMNPKDLSALVFNLLDNAIKAAHEVNGEVEFKMNYNKGNLFITVINDCQKEPRFISTRKNHGYGLEIIRGIVDKYNGEMEIYYHNKKVESKVLLCLNDE